MDYFWRIMMVSIVFAGLGVFSSVGAVEVNKDAVKKDAAPNVSLQPGQLLGRDGKVLAGNAVCMHCHDENEQKPLLSVLKTRHGVSADKRAPTCQGCHGLSDKHIHNEAGTKVRSKPDITYGPKAVSSTETQTETCLDCHRGGKRMHWDGSQHQSRTITCANCHTLHTPNDRVLSKVTQSEVCFDCHKEQRAQTHRIISTHPLDAGKMSCSDCHNPHGSVAEKLLVKTRSMKPVSCAMPRNGGLFFGSIPRYPKIVRRVIRRTARTPHRC